VVYRPKLNKIIKSSQLHRDVEHELEYNRYLCNYGILEGLLNKDETTVLRESTGEYTEILMRALNRGVTEEEIMRLIYFSVVRKNIIEIGD